ncbi:hypothetical protein AVEN_116157-1 [Araneus ventricosus]|uniref:Uncharacterized protein n=1 Tax=Araneus ventricosus TaxID=182803 RepID=A0A4Y2W9U9_ARAVE|nr:hypothetical protein AVEN_116157-1 [Araneus ventricosus]
MLGSSVEHIRVKYGITTSRRHSLNLGPAAVASFELSDFTGKQEENSLHIAGIDLYGTSICAAKRRNNFNNNWRYAAASLGFFANSRIFSETNF